MNKKQQPNLLITIILSVIGITVFIIGITNDYGEVPFGVAGLGFALAGITIHSYIKNKRDTTTEKGEKRSDIEIHDERNIMINAKTGETVYYLMSFFLLIASGLSVYLDVSIVGQSLLFSLLILSLVTRPIVKLYYENKS